MARNDATARRDRIRDETRVRRLHSMTTQYGVPFRVFASELRTSLRTSVCGLASSAEQPGRRVGVHGVCVRSVSYDAAPGPRRLRVSWAGARRAAPGSKVATASLCTHGPLRVESQSRAGMAQSGSPEYTPRYRRETPGPWRPSGLCRGRPAATMRAVRAPSAASPRPHGEPRERVESVE